MIAAIALPGHFAKSRIAASSDAGAFDGAVDDLKAALSRHGLARIHLAGYSLGARVALRLLVRHAEMIARATLVGVNPGLEGDGERVERARTDQAWTAMLRSQGILRFVEEWERQPLLEALSAVPEARMTARRAIRLSHDPIALAAALELLGLARMPNSWPDLPELDLEVKLIAGEHDVKFRAIGERMVRSMRNAILTVVRSAGHDVPFEQPEALASALARAVD
jgi:2-succinyl-6-hydroxy-2,4-cyclohexadiene-1-carboxylate synthase